MSGAVSARGLFRATGKTAKPVAGLFDDGEIGVVAQLPREKDDFYATRDPACVRALAAHEGQRWRELGGRIWEPAAGDGTMVRDIEALGFDVVASDLVDRGCGAEIRDYFDYTSPPAPVMVTNPPYNCVNWRDGKGRWVTHGLDRLGCSYMALLLNWSWPGASNLVPMWTRLTPTRTYLMTWKVDFTGQGAPPMLSAWFVWDGPPRVPGVSELRMLPRADADRGGLFGGSS
jgi:hypothetical protein